MMITVDLNSDLGEYHGAERLAVEADIMPLLTSVNIACGFHAGTPELMRKTALSAARCGVSIGAHPGFRNAEHFGRRDMCLPAQEIENLMAYQIGALAGVVTLDGMTLTHVKPHGALYNRAATDRATAGAIVRAVQAVDRRLIIFALAGSELVEAARAAGLAVVSEAFADRAYQPDGSLVSRSQNGAVLQTEDDVRVQLRHLMSGFVACIDGSMRAVQADSICIHTDTPHAAQLALMIRRDLEEAGIRIAAARPG